jgi:hypothetical protein
LTVNTTEIYYKVCIDYSVGVTLCKKRVAHMQTEQSRWRRGDLDGSGSSEEEGGFNTVPCRPHGPAAHVPDGPFFLEGEADVSQATPPSIP